MGYRRLQSVQGYGSGPELVPFSSSQVALIRVNVAPARGRNVFPTHEYEEVSTQDQGGDGDGDGRAADVALGDTDRTWMSLDSG